jgi:hypothetical protein
MISDRMIVHFSPQRSRDLSKTRAPANAEIWATPKIISKKELSASRPLEVKSSYEMNTTTAGFTV